MSSYKQNFFIMELLGNMYGDQPLDFFNDAEYRFLHGFKREAVFDVEPVNGNTQSDDRPTLVAISLAACHAYDAVTADRTEPFVMVSRAAYQASEFVWLIIEALADPRRETRTRTGSTSNGMAVFSITSFEDHVVCFFSFDWDYQFTDVPFCLSSLVVSSAVGFLLVKDKVGSDSEDVIRFMFLSKTGVFKRNGVSHYDTSIITANGLFSDVKSCGGTPDPINHHAQSSVDSSVV